MRETIVPIVAEGTVEERVKRRLRHKHFGIIFFVTIFLLVRRGNKNFPISIKIFQKKLFQTLLADVCSILARFKDGSASGVLVAD